MNMGMFLDACTKQIFSIKKHILAYVKKYVPRLINVLNVLFAKVFVTVCQSAVDYVSCNICLYHSVYLIV